MVELPGFTDFTVTIEPLIDAVATVVVPDDTVTAPCALLTVNVPLFGYAIVPLLALRVNGLFACVTVQVNEPVLVTAFVAVI